MRHHRRRQRRGRAARPIDHAHAFRSRPPAYSQDLAELIVERCAAGGSGPGSRLPTERQLADDLGVTRTMVRHALALLEAEGRISREVGRGTFLRGGDPGAPTRRGRDAGRPATSARPT